MSTDRFPHSERALVVTMGLTQKAIRAVRADSLKRNEDWDVIGGEVRYSDQGKERLHAFLKISPEAPPPAEAAQPGLLTRMIGALKKSPEPEAEAVEEGPAEEPAAAPPARELGAIEELKCTKCYKPNKLIVEATTGSGESALVRVRDNTNLQPGMLMKCRFTGGRLWELAQRLPRQRGRW